MSNYIKLSTLEFPRHEGDIRLEHPEIAEDQTGSTFPCPNTYAPVAHVEPPEFNAETQLVQMLTPVQDESGNWKMAWAIRDLTAEEIEYKKTLMIEMAKLRIARETATTSTE